MACVPSDARLRVEWHVDPAAPRLAVPPMTLQPLVDNAISHGMGGRLEGGRVRNAARREADRLLLRVEDDGAGYRLQPLAGVARFSAEDGAVYAHGSARWIMDYTLRELEERVGTGFVPASRSELVNVDHVARIVAPGDGSTTLVLAGGTRIPVSRRQSAEVWRALGK